jgi:hypothetical protein
MRRVEKPGNRDQFVEVQTTHHVNISPFRLLNLSAVIGLYKNILDYNFNLMTFQLRQFFFSREILH